MKLNPLNIRFLPKFILKAFLALSFLIFASHAEASLKEYQLKAAFIYNFAKFIDWPEYNSKEFRICVLGSDPFGSTLNPARTKDIDGKKIVIERKPGVDFISSCQILFVGNSEAGNLTKILEKLGSNPVLTVSDISGFSRKGGVVEFTENEGKIRFKINSKLASQKNLKISAKLLELAEEVN